MRSFTSFLAVFLCILMLAGSALAQEHVVTPGELRQAVQSAADQRQANVAKLEKFFSTDAARKALAAARLDPSKLTAAVSSLSDEELARLSAKAAQIDNNFAASGISLTNQQVTYIIIGVIAIAIIAIVASR